MDPPTDDTELKPEALEVEKEGGATFHCDLYDADLVHKIAQEFLPGLASACVDNTTGGLFRSPGSVAVDIRREMVDYLVQRSENFVAESVVVDGTPNEEISENPKDIISDMVDDFASSKRNFFSRVTGWLLSERMEDRIDDFVQEMEVNGFWLLNRREAVAQTLLKNVDFKNMYHCNMSFKSQEELDEHKLNCGFRTMLCTNEGCDARFSVVHTEKHDSMCPFKILKCEQSCEAMLMRREMDRHCITVCPMKLVKCPFHSIGCQASIPQRTTDQHKSEDVRSHLVYVLQVVHKEASEEDLKARAEELIKMSTPGKLAAARDARALTYSIKDLEAKLGPLKVTAKKSDETNDSADKKAEDNADTVNDSTDKKDEKTTKHVTFAELPNEKKESVNSPSKGDDSQDRSQEQKKLAESQPDNNNAAQEKPKESHVQSESQPNNKDVVQERSIESPVGGEDGLPKANKPEVQVGEPIKYEPNEAEGEQISKSSEEKASEPIKNEPNEAEGEQRSKSSEEKFSEPIKNKPNKVTNFISFYSFIIFL